MSGRLEGEGEDCCSGDVESEKAGGHL